MGGASVRFTSVMGMMIVWTTLMNKIAKVRIRIKSGERAFLILPVSKGLVEALLQAQRHVSPTFVKTALYICIGNVHTCPLSTCPHVHLYTCNHNYVIVIHVIIR